MEDDDDDGLREIEQTTRAVLETVHDIADRVQPPANARGMLIGIAAIMIARNLLDGEEPGAASINATWAERGFPWKMVRSLQ